MVRDRSPVPWVTKGTIVFPDQSYPSKIGESQKDGVVRPDEVGDKGMALLCILLTGRLLTVDRLRWVREVVPEGV